MPDPYAVIRSLDFMSLAGVLGIDLQRFRHQKNEWHGYCPIHNGQKNNNSFHYQDGTGKWHCFSCNAKGSGAIDLTKAVKDIGFQAAVELLGSIPPPQQKNPTEGQTEANTGVLKPYAGKYEHYKVPCEWLDKRSYGQAEKYGVFCYSNPARKSQYNGRVLVPFRDPDGTLYSYMGRAIEGEPKYLIPSGFPKSRFLFGSYELKSGTFGQIPLKYVFLVESCWTVMKFASLGVPAVALYGWSVSDEQAQLLTLLTKAVVYLPDTNKREAASQCLPAFASHLWVKFPVLPDGVEDPEELSLPQIQSLLTGR